MIAALLTDLWPYAAGALVALAGFLGLRSRWKAEGREEANRRARDADHQRARGVREDLDDVLRRHDGGGVPDPADRRGYRD